MRRRDLFLSGGALAAAALAYQLKPRRTLRLLRGGKLEAAIPMNFGPWKAEDYSEMVRPTDQKSLSAVLYNEVIGRTYRNDLGDEVMMLIAYGDTQSDLLQLHRPETCYPAFGFMISASAVTRVPLPGGVELPARTLVATAQSRQENIMYWTRFGEYLPIDGSEQRSDRLKASLHGYIPDGLLARCSVVSTDAERSFSTMRGFVADLISAVPAAQRPALIGTRRAEALSKVA